MKSWTHNPLLVTVSLLAAFAAMLTPQPPFTQAAPAAVARATIQVVVAKSTPNATFVELDVDLPPLGSSAVAWADYDNDGDLDFLLTGQEAEPDFDPVIRIYRNDGGTFVDAGATLHPVMDGAVAWGDYDNDGDVDLALTGSSREQDHFSEIYQNDGGTFSAISPNIANVSQSSVAWADYDNDGDLDLLLTGKTGISTHTTKLYRNDGGTFVDSGVPLPDLDYGVLAWADFDRDGDHDFYLSGRTQNGVLGHLYQNEGGTFTAIAPPGLIGVFEGSADWGDFDGDGDPDLLLSGRSDFGETARIYRNDGEAFTDIGADLAAAKGATAAWGDSDNDGRLDVLLTGYREIDSTLVAKVYRNVGGNFVDIEASLNGVDDGSAAWGDYDNDGDLDLIISGVHYRLGSFTKIYRNDVPTANTPPAPPTHLTRTFHAEGVEFRWRPAPDAESDTSGLTYNLCVGTTPEGGELLSPMSDTSGYRQLPRRGNVGQALRWRLKKPLDEGLYYWGVQTVDQAFAGSPFTTDCFFVGNTAPAVNAALPDTTLVASGPMLVRDLQAPTAVFIDPDADPLTYSATSSDPQVASASVSGSVLTVVPLAPGEVTISVVADDGKCETAVNSFEIDVAPNPPPVILHSPTGTSDLNQDVLIQAEISDANGIAEATLRYRRGGKLAWSEQPMVETDGLYQATIPGTAVTSRGVAYVITAADTAGAAATHPSEGIFAISVRLPEPGVARETPQPAGSAQNAYRLIGMPLDLAEADPAAVLEDDLGAYDPKRWRFFGLEADQTYAEFPNTGDIRPGTAFWLIVKEAGHTLDTGDGASVPIDGFFTLPLHAKWNFVANPFHFPVSVENVRLASGRPVELRQYTGQWNDPLDEPVLTVEPFEGYALFAASEDTLLIDPLLNIVPDKTTQAVQSPGPSDAVWSMRIRARAQEARDVDTFALIVPGARAGHDAWDRPEPPVIGGYVSVYFRNPEGQMPAARYAVDARPEPQSGVTWDLMVATSVGDRVVLTFEEVSRRPQGFEAWLIDEAARVSQNLRQNNTYVLAGPTEGQPKSLRLVLGAASFVEDEIANSSVVPEAFQLLPNFPNPFNPATTLRFALPREARVSLKIYNLLGESVRTLMDQERRSAGYHAVVWDGRDDVGTAVASGLYVVQFRAEGVVRTRKILLLK